MVTRLFLVLSILSCSTACSGPGGRLTAIELLPNYPSGSGLAYHNEHIYIMGDDAPFLLVLDSLFNPTDSIRIFGTSEKRIAKEIKPDTEALTIFTKNNNTALLIVGSGSLSPSRDSCYLLNLSGKEITKYDLDSFYQRLKNSGISTLNIEGAASFPGGVLLASRGNKSFPKNYLVVTSNAFWLNQSTASIALIKTGANSDTSTFKGISGLDYSYKTDQLFITISTENTNSAYDDGEIGQSYLWIINDFSSKVKLHSLNPDKIISLSDIDHRFNHHKIESVCIVSQQNSEKILALTADDDKGGTVVFRVVISE